MAAGARRLAAGSALFGAQDFAEALRLLREDMGYLGYLLIALAPIMWVGFALWRHRARLFRTAPSSRTPFGFLACGMLVLFVWSSFYTVGLALSFVFSSGASFTEGWFDKGGVFLFIFIFQMISAIILKEIVSKASRVD
ncbi:hypothetical protein HYZ80_01245 [Candidatus Parcubacteria bacterium]|nr:hypothetical protein [Candidatus Parcubacteria bacterium]